jgi:hypothetical protein
MSFKNTLKIKYQVKWIKINKTTEKIKLNFKIL